MADVSDSLGILPYNTPVGELGRVGRGSAAGVDPGLLELNALAQAGRGVASALGDVGRSVWDFVRVPRDVWSGKYSEDEIRALAPQYALGLVGGGTPAGVAFGPGNALGIFGGVRSLTKSTPHLWGARTMERMGATPDKIYESTGWFRGADGEWRYTISDAPAVTEPKLQGMEPGAVGRLGDVLHHPPLYSAYPELADWSFEYSGTTPNWGETQPLARSIVLSNRVPPGQVLPVLLHEAQHGVQSIEGFARGSSPKEFLPPEYEHYANAATTGFDILREQLSRIGVPLEAANNILLNVLDHRSEFDPRLVESLPKYVRDNARYAAERNRELKQITGAARQQYRATAGEVEARGVEEQYARGDWTTPVWKHEGYIPMEKQVVLKNAPLRPLEPEGRTYNLVPVEHDPFALVPVDYDPWEGNK